MKEMNSFSFGEAIKLEVKIPNAKQSAAIKLLKQLVDSTYWTEDKEDDVLRLLRFTKSTFGATMNEIWMFRSYKVATKLFD